MGTFQQNLNKFTLLSCVFTEIYLLASTMTPDRNGAFLRDVNSSVSISP
jgi:hypothetical protein